MKNKRSNQAQSIRRPTKEELEGKPLSRPLIPGMKPEPRKFPELTIDVAARAEGHIRCSLNMAEGILVALGSALSVASHNAETPETRDAIDRVVKVVEESYKSVTAERSAAVSLLYKRAHEEADKRAAQEQKGSPS